MHFTSLLFMNMKTFALQNYSLTASSGWNAYVVFLICKSHKIKAPDKWNAKKRCKIKSDSTCLLSTLSLLFCNKLLLHWDYQRPHHIFLRYNYPLLKPVDYHSRRPRCIQVQKLRFSHLLFSDCLWRRWPDRVKKLWSRGTKNLRLESSPIPHYCLPLNL